ncbi:MAG: hypothetical protein JSR33_11605 [Proteobacteria bacterium]|nr:hypothetical protein [Pseudomonadota bacterium]
MANSTEPDYIWWAKADYWSLEDAALLLHGIDPISCRPLGIGETEIPLGFREVHKTCNL